jgi:hypothetical protein
MRLQASALRDGDRRDAELAMLRAMSDPRPRPDGTEQEVVSTDIDPRGSALGVDDHVVTPHPHGIGHQPTAGLDRGVDGEHLASPAQGVRVEATADADAAAPSEAGATPDDGTADHATADDGTPDRTAQRPA